MTGEDRPHRGRRNSDAETLQFADDPPVTPSRVLACQSNNQRLDAPIERRPPRPVRIGPAPPDQLAVPAKQRRRADRQARPRTLRQSPRKRGEDRSIDRTEPRSLRLPAQDRQLMPEHQDLELLRALRPAQQHDQLNQTTKRQIDERPDHDNLPNQGTPKLSRSVPTPLCDREPSF